MGWLDTGVGSLGLEVTRGRVMATEGGDLVKERKASSLSAGLPVRPQGRAWAGVLTCAWPVRKLSQQLRAEPELAARGSGLSSEVAGPLSMSRLSPLLSIYLGDPDMCWARDPCFLSPWQAHGSWAPRLQGHATAT